MTYADGAPGKGRTVLLILHGEEVGGASLSVLRVTSRLEALGWKPVVWAPDPSDLIDEVRARGLRAHGAPRPVAGYSWKAMKIPPGPAARAARAPRYYRELVRVIREERPALAHCNSMYTLDEAAVAKGTGLPLAFHVHEMVGPSRKHRVARELLHLLGTTVIGVSQAGVEALGGAERGVRLVHEGTDAPTNIPARSIRSDELTVGMIGVIARRKGTDLFVEAARRVRAVSAGVHFELVGAATDPLDADWARDVLRSASDAGITYAASTDVSKALARWHIFVLPSRVDPFPIVVLEAMGAGLPVVGAAVDGIVEQLTDETGVLVPADDPEALADAILELSQDQDLRRRIGLAAHERVMAEFSLDRQAHRLSDAYLATLGEKARLRP